MLKIIRKKSTTNGNYKAKNEFRKKFPNFKISQLFLIKFFVYMHILSIFIILISKNGHFKKRTKTCRFS